MRLEFYRGSHTNMAPQISDKTKLHIKKSGKTS